MATCLIGMGANLGDRASTLEHAIDRLRALPQVRVIGRSAWHETTPAGGPAGQPLFLNGAVVLEADLSPEQLLDALQQIELQAGRTRHQRWDARTLDLDLLLYDQLVMRTPRLEIPHPRMAVRRFVLDPAVEVAASMRHPTSGWTVQHLHEHLQASTLYIAITGPPGVGKSQLARAVAQRLDANLIADLPLVRPAARSPSPIFERQLEWNEWRVDLLAATRNQQQPRWVITDFWLPQAMAYASILLAPAEAQRFHERSQPIADRAPAPRFTVALHAPVDRLWSELASANVTLGPLDRSRLMHVVAALDAQTHEPGHGPVLHFDVDGQNADDIATQIVAAAQASQ